MAKAQTATAPQAPKLATREGLTKHSGDVVGFRDLEEQGPLYGIVRAAKANDSQLDSKKPSIFVIFELLEDTEVTEGSGDDQTKVMAKKGEMAGLWLKGGMRQIRDLCGLAVLVQHTGEKKLKGKPAAFNAMKTFQFDVGKGAGTRVPIIEDNRKDSRDEDLPCGFGAGADPSKPMTADDPGF